jgi:hypothetical protein
MTSEWNIHNPLICIKSCQNEDLPIHNKDTLNKGQIFYQWVHSPFGDDFIYIFLTDLKIARKYSKSNFMSLLEYRSLKIDKILT